MTNQPACGNCKHFVPYRDAETGRVHPRAPGRCGWLPDSIWPMAYRRNGFGWDRGTAATPVPVWADTDAATCACFSTATPAEARAASGLLDALARFLENHGDDFLTWRNGCIVVETYYDKKFRALGGDTNHLISLFEDYCNMTDAARHYIVALRKASNDPKLSDGGAWRGSCEGGAQKEAMDV